MEIHQKILTGIYLLIFMTAACKKSGNSISIIPDYTANMGGTRIWHGVSYIDGGLDTSSLNDTFAIIVVNDSTIVCADYSLTYRNTDSSANAYIFSFSYFTGIPGVPATITVAYDYKNNSMTYSGFWPSHGGPYGITLSTP